MNQSSRAILALGAACALAVTAATPAWSAPTPANPLYGFARQFANDHARFTPQEGGGGEEGGEDPLEVADQAEQYAFARSAPADDVSAEALLAARRQAAALPSAAAATSEITDQRYDAEPAGYTDPVESNAGAGFGIVSGRTTALAVDGSTYYVGTADGGVWKSTDAGAHWVSIWDRMPSLSIGALLVQGHTLWVGTGEANTSSDSYVGTGVYRSTDGGVSFAQVGGTQLIDRTTFRLRYDGAGRVYAATSKGLYRHAANTAAGSWQLVLKPDPNLGHTPYDTSFITDVVIKPGTGGKTILAVNAWRNGTPYNGFYLSTTGGASGTFHEITPSGAIDAGDIGRTTLEYSADGTRLYAIVQSVEKLLGGDDTNLQGVFVSKNGNPSGPYTLIADSAKLGDSGSALRDLDGYHVGIQSWYNQVLAVDPHDANHVYVSLEEVFETRDGGATFSTASPYWNYGLACEASCPKTTHPDQHALALTPGGTVVIGNDGGVYSRPMSVTGYGHWRDLNATLRTLQYYDAAAGKLPNGTGYWGGLQDNGTSFLQPGTINIEPAGGDGGTVLVDPANAQRSVGEYVDLTMYSTTDGGHTFTTISPECGSYLDEDKCDPSARFIAPFQADLQDTNRWVAAGNDVWVTTKGWDTRCETACDWTNVHSFGLDALGGYNVGTAVAVSGPVIYAAYVDSSGNPSPSFKSGIDTNFGGYWHHVTSPVLPNRFVAGLTVDPRNPAHVYAVYNGYSRRWIPGGGLGTIFESTDGGGSWRNISGNLPDAPGDGVAIVHGQLVLATDVGVFVAPTYAPSWSRVDGLPNSVANNVRLIPGTNSALIAMHGRGMWRVQV